MFMDLSQAHTVAKTKAGISPAIAPSPLSFLERMAVAIGMNDGAIARRRSGLLNFLIFFTNPKPISLANPRLEALRAYTELARAMFPQSVPAASLEEAGFSKPQIRELLQMIVYGARSRLA